MSKRKNVRRPTASTFTKSYVNGSYRIKIVKDQIAGLMI